MRIVIRLSALSLHCLLPAALTYSVGLECVAEWTEVYRVREQRRQIEWLWDKGEESA